MLIVQATELGAALPTTLVVPLDVVADPYVDRELLVYVPADEAGTAKDHVAIPTHLRFVRSDRFEPGRVGRLRARTLAELDEKLGLLLDLRISDRQRMSICSEHSHGCSAWWFAALATSRSPTSSYQSPGASHPTRCR